MEKDLGNVMGPTGPAGANGITPTIGANGNWYIGGTDTGKPSRGATGPQGPAGGTGWGTGYKLMSANSYDVSVRDVMAGGIKSNTITIRRTIPNSMLVPVLRRTGWLNVSGVEWANDTTGDRRLKVEFLNTTTGTHTGIATIQVLEFVKVE